MPELPEVEHLRRTLEPALVGAILSRARLVRPDIMRHTSGLSDRRISPRDLLNGATITQLRRHGKQLALMSNGGKVLCVQLGMTGQLRLVPPGQRLGQSDHVHCHWRVEGPDIAGRLVFRDPRRFGGLSALPSANALEARWGDLGPDALTIDTRQLSSRLAVRRRPIKSALLEQRILAGLGNIYADECLFRARIHPQSRCDALPPDRIKALARAIRDTLRAALRAGGTTLRDYVDAGGIPGAYRQRHRVYARGGEPCCNCGTKLRHVQLAQRTTTYCGRCQRRYVGRNALLRY